MAEEYITIQQAAEIAGYRSASTLHAAARSGRLRIVTLSPRHQFTTRAWLADYLAGVKPRGNPRGQGDDVPS